MKIIIRDVSERDLDEIYRLEKEIFGLEGYSKSLIKFLIFFSNYFKVACKDSEIIGYLCGEVRGNMGHIITIGVKKNYRRRKIGSRLIMDFINYLKMNNIHSVYLEVSVNNHAAIKFYEKIGFKIKDRIPRYYRDGSDAYIMEMRYASAGGVSSSVSKEQSHHQQ